MSFCLSSSVTQISKWPLSEAQVKDQACNGVHGLCRFVAEWDVKEQQHEPFAPPVGADAALQDQMLCTCSAAEHQHVKRR